MKKLMELLKETVSGGNDAVLVTVVASSGSTPRGAGARMLVTEKGRIYGTIGGGAIEFESEKRALAILKNRRSSVEKFRLHPNDVADLGMICGGACDVYFRFIRGGDESAVSAADAMISLIGGEERGFIICDVTEGENAAPITVYGDKSGIIAGTVPDSVIASLTSKPACIECSGRTYFCEQFTAPGFVYIFGGGHVAQALVPVLAAVGFRCIVIEDRPEFAEKSLFPGVYDTRIADVSEYDGIAASVTDADYVCIMTRGHKNDYDVQRSVLKSGAKYIGVIGSKKKSAAVFARLMSDDGYTEEDCRRITTPIGLDIGGETPAEIAVSIAGQLIRVRHGLEARP